MKQRENIKVEKPTEYGLPCLAIMGQITELRVEEGAIPRLCRFFIQFCLRLTTLPDGLRYLTNLRELNITGMRRELHRQIEKDGEDFYKIQHVPSLVIGEPSPYS
ncbi:unnamed protein product [Prunus armeniaca]|uniref:Uncharacterized protein n=1 Tax=Prunus armeniaca TaxID=36596 RepID=A0A6J5VVT9_PRUAR|nr:unnamed protein product [Prunus armeniaca]